MSRSPHAAQYPHVTLAVEIGARHELIRTHVFMVSNNSYDLERFGVEAPRETLTEGKLSVYWLPHTSRCADALRRALPGRPRAHDPRLSLVPDDAHARAILAQPSEGRHRRRSVRAAHAARDHHRAAVADRARAALSASAR